MIKSRPIELRDIEPGALVLGMTILALRARYGRGTAMKSRLFGNIRRNVFVTLTAQPRLGGLVERCMAGLACCIGLFVDS